MLTPRLRSHRRAHDNPGSAGPERPRRHGLDYGRLLLGFLLSVLLIACAPPVAAPTVTAPSVSTPPATVPPAAPNVPTVPPTIAPPGPASTATSEPIALASPTRPAATPAIGTATPIPTPLGSPFAYGVASGDVTSDSVVLWTRTAGPVDVVAEISVAASMSNPTTLPPVRASAESDDTIKVVANGLNAGTQYYYRFRAGGDLSPVGTFKTAYAASADATVTFGFSGDANWAFKPYPLLTSLVKEKLDFFFFLGDLIYENTNQGSAAPSAVEDLAGYRYKYRENREPRGNSASKIVPMQDLYRSFGQYSVFDNHETGNSVADKNAPPYITGGAQVGGRFVNETPGFQARIQAYREYQPVREVTVSGTGDPRLDQTGKFYRAIPWGANVDLIILDDRSYRDAAVPTNDPRVSSCTRTMLGAPQLAWFEQELRSDQERKVPWKIVVISSPIQQFGTVQQLGGPGYDGPKSWPGDYICERNKLLQFVDDQAIENVVFLTTDNHYTAINNLNYNVVPDDPKSPTKAVRNAFEILTGAIGASPGNPAGFFHVTTNGPSPHEADRQVLAVWNGDAPNAQGELRGLKQVGLDPIGLEPGFPGLVASSIRTDGGTPGVVEPADFASLNTFAYAILTLDRTTLTVQVKGIPFVVDPTTLDNSDVEKQYESRQARDLLSFQVKAQ